MRKIHNLQLFANNMKRLAKICGEVGIDPTKFEIEEICPVKCGTRYTMINKVFKLRLNCVFDFNFNKCLILISPIEMIVKGSTFDPVKLVESMESNLIINDEELPDDLIVSMEFIEVDSRSIIISF